MYPVLKCITMGMAFMTIWEFLGISPFWLQTALRILASMVAVLVFFVSTIDRIVFYKTQRFAFALFTAFLLSTQIGIWVGLACGVMAFRLFRVLTRGISYKVGMKVSIEDRMVLYALTYIYPAYLAIMATKGRYPAVSLAAVKKIKDQDLLAKIALEADDDKVRKIAIETRPCWRRWECGSDRNLLRKLPIRPCWRVLS
jgi:hypothetical protein